MNDWLIGFFIGTFLAGVAIGVGGAFLPDTEEEKLKIEAVQRGVAEWKVDETGKTTWQWKD